jgi:branched-chain amino acid transport system substrate-binding protein
VTSLIQPSGRREKFRIAAAFAAILVAATPLATGAADPLEIDVLLPMTGSASFYAVAQQQSLHVIEESVNKAGGIGGRPIKFVLNDDQTDAKVDVQLAGQILAKHPAVLLGPTLTAQCNALMPLLKDGPATWCFTPGPRPVNGGYVFAFGADTSHTSAVSMRYLKARGIKRIGMISSTDATGQDGDKNVDAAAAAEAITVVDHEHFNPTDISVTAQLAHIKGANPQAIVVWTTGTPFGTVLRAIQELGIDVPIVSTNGNITYGQMKQYKAFLPKELWFPGAAFLDPSRLTDKGVIAVVKTFNDGIAAQGGKPDWGNNNCYDGTRLFLEALKKYGTNATSTQVRDYVASVQNWPGINGRYNFVKEPQRGLGDDSVVMVRWNGGTESWAALSKPGGQPL